MVVEEDGGGWAAVARKDAAVVKQPDVKSLLSTAGLTTVVVDANAIIGGGFNLRNVADRFFTVKEVLAEVRDPTSRFHLGTLPLEIKCLEPSEEALKKVVEFARATGDVHTLSDVDLKLIALTYTLEAEVHGTSHIRDSPPPLVLQSAKVGRHQKDPPGWGSVSNPEEWEGIDDGADGSNSSSRILGLKTLSLADTEAQDITENVAAQSGSKENTPSEASVGISGSGRRRARARARGKKSLEKQLGLSEAASASHQTVVDEPGNRLSVSGSQGHLNLINHQLETTTLSSGREQMDSTTELELPIDIAREKMSAEAGIDKEVDGLSSVTEVEDRPGTLVEPLNVDGGEWQKAISRSTRRQKEKRAQRRALRNYTQLGDDLSLPVDESCSQGGTDVVETPQDERVDAEGLDCFENSSEAGFTVVNSEEIQSPRSQSELWTSSVGCMTGDYAMQNVILQMGLRLLSPAGKHVRELNKWVLKCQACFKVTNETERLFCPKCGNGGTLYRVSVTIGPDGCVVVGRSRRPFLRGTRYSLPHPKGGREGALTNPILREDQLPAKPRKSKKPVMEAFSSSDIVFAHPQDRQNQHSAAVKNAASLFCGRRNPNERRRSQH